MVMPGCTPFTVKVGIEPLTVAMLGLSVATVTSEEETDVLGVAVTIAVPPTGTNTGFGDSVICRTVIGTLTVAEALHASDAGGSV